MIKPFTISAGTRITQEIACGFINEHIQHTHDRYDRLERYYEGGHPICDREKRSVLANNRLVCNHAKYISDTCVGYFAGNPVKYSGDGLEPLLELLRTADSDTQDIDLAQKASIFGTAYEFIYTDEDGQPRLYSPDPRQAFVIYDDTVQQKPVAGVYYYKLHDSVTDRDTGYSVYLCTASMITHFVTDTGFTPKLPDENRPHGMNGVPLIEIYNNSTCGSDFEPVLSLIDAYNILQSDRVNDKEQFVEAILLIKGSVLGDDNDEKSESYKALRENGLLELDADSSAEWLTRQFDENSVEVLRKSLEQDIHKFANVPCMSDESFGGNASGVAMRYKLLGFEQITKIKERYFREGLKERLRLLCSWLDTTGKAHIDSRDISIQFTRALPVNETEVAQLVSELRDLVPLKTLLGLLPFVDDPEAAAEEIREQQNNFPNLPPDMSDEQP
jgi:SPP1 family phage portal protein